MKLESALAERRRKEEEDKKEAEKQRTEQKRIRVSAKTTRDSCIALPVYRSNSCTPQCIVGLTS